MTTPIHVVDAFTSRPGGGNPAAVCLLEAPASEAWMQAVAREMNLSETAFLVPTGASFGLRWFTPTVEVALCGHATLASAHVLWETGRLASSAVAAFDTRSGRLTARRAGGLIELDFPVKHVSAAAPPPELIAALGVKSVAAGRSDTDWLIEVADEHAVRACAPDFHALKRTPVRGVIVTSRAEDPAVHFVSRFFAPGSGIDEDPVTGSAHCALAAWWAPKLRRTEFAARQISARRGELWVALAGERVRLAGHAVTTLRGEWCAEPA